MEPAKIDSSRQDGTEGDLIHRAPSSPTDKADVYTCPMDPEVHESKPGACPKCGMSLEAPISLVPTTKTDYVCPMHPEIVQDTPGSCPICGMALEPATVTLEEEANPELVDMTRRFWISLVLSVPVLFLAMSEMIPGQPVQQALSLRLLYWIQFALATPVVLWGGWPFFQRGWTSIINRSPAQMQRLPATVEWVVDRYRRRVRRHGI